MIRLVRVKEDPILSPSTLPWEDMLVFNPGATIYKDKIYLLYRAMGTGDEISRLGLAVSKDGINFERKAEPLYQAKGHKFETLGIEDVRVAKIEDIYYLVYTAVSQEFDEYTSEYWKKEVDKIPRIALSTTQDFITFTDYDVILPHITGKDATLFPKKINGEYGLLYRVGVDETYFAHSPNMYSWETSYPLLNKRSGMWDSKRAGIGSPPIETEKGWLIFYHGVDEDDVYRLGFLFLDLNNPTKILYRSPYPILEPTQHFEKYGFVPNVVFTCGAVEKDGKYFVYYGAADEVIGLATVEKKDILNVI